MSREMAASRVDYRRVAMLVALLAIIVALWDTWALYPLRLLVVFFHELSHGIAAVLTGGSIVEIRMNAQEGGRCITRGGVPFVTASAGYIGSLMWGGAVLLVATRTKASQFAVGALGALLIVVTAIWVRPIVGFGFGFGLATGLALTAAGYWFKAPAHETMLTIIGLTSCLYAVLDIKSDILDRSRGESDALLLAHATMIPAVFWGVLWLGISLVLATHFIRAASLRSSGGNGTPTIHT